MAITRDQIITKHATLAEQGDVRFLDDYVVSVIPNPDGGIPALVTVQDSARDYVYRCHAHDVDADLAEDDEDNAPRDYVAGPWEALITS